MLLLIPALLAAAGAGVAAAATLATSSVSLGSGNAAVPICDSNGFTYTRTLSSGQNVATVTVSGIDASCAGGTLQLTLANAANVALGSGSASVTGSGNVTVTIAGTAPAASIASYKVAITG